MINEKHVIDYMEGSADPETVAQIREQLSDPKSFVSGFMDELAADADKMGNRELNWEKLLPKRMQKVFDRIRREQGKTEH